MYSIASDPTEQKCTLLIVHLLQCLPLSCLAALVEPDTGKRGTQPKGIIGKNPPPAQPKPLTNTSGSSVAGTEVDRCLPGAPGAALENTYAGAYLEFLKWHDEVTIFLTVSGAKHTELIPTASAPDLAAAIAAAQR